VRDYVFVDDVAAAIVSALGGSRGGITTANIAGGAGVSVAELAMAAAVAAGRAVTVRERGATRPAGAEIRRLVADIARAREAFGWRPTVALDEGLRRTIAQMVAA
jgi:UDP-glucose 4-epimerase